MCSYNVSDGLLDIHLTSNLTDGNSQMQLLGINEHFPGMTIFSIYVKVSVYVLYVFLFISLQKIDLDP